MRKCKKCGQVVPPNAPFGRCPSCLLGLAFLPQTSEAESIPDAFVEANDTHSAISGHPDQAVRPGRRFGDYDLIKVVGRGGMGVVFQAIQVSLRRLVAVKVVNGGELASVSTVQRFRIEAEAAAKLHHPNIVPIYEIGEVQGQYYLSMKLIEGDTLSESIQRSYRPKAAILTGKQNGGVARISVETEVQLFELRDAAKLISTIARAIHFAHQHGVLHRDLKSSNILLDAQGEPHIADFGLAKILEHELGVTRTSEVMGTPSYMSPEQCAGDQASTASDVWGLGVILYELIAGQLPFRADNTPSLLRMISEMDPPSPRQIREEIVERLHEATVGKEKKRSSIDLDLETICLKCLEKHPAHRYASAAGLADDLDRWLRSEPILARRATPFERTVKWVQRQPLLAFGTLLLLVMFASGVGGVFWQWNRAERHAREERHQRERAEVELKRAENAEIKMRENLREAYLSQERALRITGELESRFRGLDVLGKAAAIRPSLELRNEAIACMALTDMNPLGFRNFETGDVRAIPDADCKNYALIDAVGAVSIRRYADEHELGHLPSLGTAVTSPLRFSPDGKLIALCYADGRLRIWNWSQAKVLLEVPDYGDAEFSPDSLMLATSDSTHIVFHDLAQQKQIQSIPLPGFLSTARIEDFLLQIRFQTKGPMLAVSSGHQTNVLILDTRTGETVLKLSHPKEVAQVAWHPGGRYLAVACWDQSVYLWDTTNAQRIKVIACNAVSVVFNRGGELLATSGWDVGIDLWSFPGCRRLVTTGQRGNGMLRGFSSDDTTLVVGGWINGWSIESYGIAHQVEMATLVEEDTASDTSPASLVFSNDGERIAYTTSSGIGIADVASRRPLGSLPGAWNLMGLEAKSDDLIVVGQSNLVRWSMQPSASARPVDISQAKLTISVTPRGGRMGWISRNGEICAVWGDDRCQIFHTQSFVELSRIKSELGMWYQSLSPDGALLAIGARQSPLLQVWDTRSGQRVKEFTIEDERQGSNVAFSPDGRRLMISSAHRYQLLDVKDWSEVLRISEPDNPLPARMAYSHDGKILAGCAFKNVVRLYDAESGKVLADLTNPHPKIICGLAFSPDNTKLAVCHARNSVVIWDLRAIRQRLASMQLDWERTPFPAQKPPSATSKSNR